jgi:AcrR family transcriptional regulator
VPKENDGDRESQRDLGPLPGGHHGLSPQQVAESQRERLLAAVATLIAERGYAATTINGIAKTAAVANRVFYANFEDKEAAFLAAFDAVADHLRFLVAQAATEVGADWSRRMIVAFRAILEFFDGEPELAGLCLVAPFTATPAIGAHFREVIASAVPYLAEGRELGGAVDDLPASTEDSLLGGIVAQLSRSLLTDAGPLIDRLPDLIEFALAPYVGAERARELAVEASSRG